LPRPAQLQLRQLDLDDRGVRQHSCAAVFRKQRQRAGLRDVVLPPGTPRAAAPRAPQVRALALRRSGVRPSRCC
jgi:hypothetical protein